MSEEISFLHLKLKNEARISEEQREEKQKRNLMLLILYYLREEGYLDTANVFETEAGPNLKKFVICDNIDLHTILKEFETYYYIRFNRRPKISKRVCDSVDAGNIWQPHKQRNHSKEYTKPNSASLPSIISNERINDRTKTSVVKRPASDTRKRNSKLPNNEEKRKRDADTTASSDMTNMDLKGHSMSTHSKNQPDIKTENNKVKNAANDLTHFHSGIGPSDRLLKPVNALPNLTAEWRDLASVISRDIYLEHPNVTWNDIIGLDVAKQLVKEAVVYPIKYPQLFQGILSPWKGLLLYGPPGTGKTLLAKAVATQCKTTFFNISASTIVSKWRGDSEKLVRVLFELARFHAPSTIFLDELDSLMGQRGSNGGSSEHEGSRRMKTELLVQMDGLSKSDDLVFLLAASNLPWELDHAMLRRLEKRIMVDLPSLEARKSMFQHFLPPHVTSNQGGLDFQTEIDYDLVSKATEGYSGSDICLVCKEAAMRPVRKIFNILETYESEDRNEIPTSLKIDSVTTNDITETLKRTKPSSRKSRTKYESWQKEYESV